MLKFIIESCPNLACHGLFTIGAKEDQTLDFETLKKLTQDLSLKYSIGLKMNMGMSNDFEQAIKYGSSFIRVGSSIFGSRY